MTDIDWTDQGEGIYTGDLDRDGDPEVVAIDTDRNGVVDAAVAQGLDGTYQVALDADENNVPDSEVVLTEAEMRSTMPGTWQLLNPAADPNAEVEPGEGTDPQTAPDTQDPDTDYPDVVVDGQLVGDPEGSSADWFRQARDGYCLPASVTQIVARYTGADYADESLFVQWANEMELFVFDAEGTPGVMFEDGLDLLDRAGIPARLEIGSPERLAEMLAEGRGVVVAVDSGEIWNGEAVEDNTTDHAVVVTGIDVERGIVILSDPGNPNGNMEEVPIDTFQDAWADSDYSMIVCDQPAPIDGVVSPDQDDSEQVGAIHEPDAAIDAAVHNPNGWAILPVVIRTVTGLLSR